jgi:NADH-quinone oxidoreductase subunit K
MLSIGLPHFLVVGAVLFALGIVTVVTRRNAVGILMGVELILNAANVNFVAFNHYVVSGRKVIANASIPDLGGQVFSIFVIVLAAAEAAVGLAIVLAIYQTFRTIDVQQTDLLRE